MELVEIGNQYFGRPKHVQINFLLDFIPGKNQNNMGGIFIQDSNI